MSKTLPKIYKRSGVYVPTPCEETTILEAPDGRIITLTFSYPIQRKILVREYPTGQLLAEIPIPVGTGGGTAIVSDGVIHVFLASPFVLQPANDILHGIISSDWTLGPLSVVYSATGTDNICNLGIVSSPHGFIMNVETQQAARQVFFLRSTNLVNWSEVGSPMATGDYLGSPKIWYSARRNEFFLTFLKRQMPSGKYYTTVARLPADLSTYEEFAGNHVLVFPDGAGETLNASDLTMVEMDGQTHMVYLDGTQNDPQYTNYRSAFFDGSMNDLWEIFFPMAASHVVPPPIPAETGLNMLPAMTSNTTAGWSVGASTVLNAGVAAWHAADRNPGSFWHNQQVAAYPHEWWATGPEIPIYSFAIKPRSGYPAQGPKNFTVSAKVGNSWQVVKTVTNAVYAEGQFTTFALDEPIMASGFRLNVTANGNSDGNLSIGDIEIRS